MGEALVLLVPAGLAGVAIGSMLKAHRGEPLHKSIRGLLFLTALIAFVLYLMFGR